MKLVFTLDNSKSVGGGDYALVKYAEYLAKRGHDITIFTTAETTYIEELRRQGIVRIFLRGYLPVKFKGSGFINRLWDSVYARTRIAKYIRSQGDVDFIIGSHTNSSIKAVMLSKRCGVPSACFVFETPEWMDKMLGDRWRKDYHGSFRRQWEKTHRYLKEADVIFAISKLTAKENEDWLKRKVDGVIYPGLDTQIVDTVPDQEKKEQMIYVGRLNELKNVDEIIKAASRIESPPKLVIIGDGEERENLMELARSLDIDCEFMGRTSDETKWKEIKKSLFMVFPSSFEGFGMPPSEALYCRIPCICTDIPMFHEIYENHVEYFPEHDIDALADQIRRLHADKRYRESRGALGHAYVKKRYDWNSSAQEIEKHLLEAKARSGR